MRQLAFPYPNNNQLENMMKGRTKINIPMVGYRKKKKKQPVKNSQRVRSNSQKLKYKYPVKHMKRYSRKSK